MMKRILMVIFILIVILMYTRCTSDIEVETPKDVSRSITFIMSHDKPGKSYFSLATEYFANHENARTDEVTTECMTIGCVIDYLNTLEHGKWSEVNLVAHGNSKTGLNLYLMDEGHKATPKRMVQEGLLKNLPQLSNSVVDSNTNINILSCGIGTNPLISLSMDRIFTTDAITPNVNCSDKYIIFRPDSNGIVQLVEASYWPYYYKRGYRPSVSQIEAEMKRLYPLEEEDWADKLVPSDGNDINSMDYHIPVSFTKIFSDKRQRPNLKSYESKMKWVRGQPQITDQLKELDMKYDDFHWTVDKRIITQDSGDREYAVKAVGMSTVLCFLEI